MGDGAPKRTTLYAAKQILKELEEGFPVEGTNQERLTYFASAMRFGIEVHESYGIDEDDLLEKIGNTVGTSGKTLKSWIVSDAQVHPDFQSGVLATQTALVDDYIHACTLVLSRLRLNLDADDWRSELTAFDHLRTIGSEVLRKYGGRDVEDLMAQIRVLEKECPEHLPLDTRRLILSVIADALKQTIGVPKKQAAADSDTEQTAASRSAWVN